jgi:hypothetical protein
MKMHMRNIAENKGTMDPDMDITMLLMPRKSLNTRKTRSILPIRRSRTTRRKPTLANANTCITRAITTTSKSKAFQVPPSQDNAARDKPRIRLAHKGAPRRLCGEK